VIPATVTDFLTGSALIFFALDFPAEEEEEEEVATKFDEMSVSPFRFVVGAIVYASSRIVYDFMTSHY
jgi:hypothetical protein